MPASMRDHIHASRDQHRLERRGYRPTYKRMYPKLGHTLRSVRELSSVNQHFRAPDLAIAVNVDDQEMSCLVEYRGNPATPGWNSNPHH